MPETTKISIGQWWSYEKNVFFKACRETSRASLGRGLLVSLSAAIGRWLCGFMAQHEIWAQVLIFIGAGVVVYLGEFLFRLFYTPAKMEKEAGEKFNEVLDRIEAAHVGIEAANKSRIEFLETQNKTLQVQLDDRAKRKNAELQLAGYHNLIENRAHEIKKMYDLGYVKKYEASYYSGKIDPDSAAFLNETAAYLEANIGAAAVVIFWDRKNIQSTASPSASGQENYWKSVIDALNHHAGQIMKIIDIYIVNKVEIK